MIQKKYRIGVTGIGRGFALMLPTLKLHPQIEVVAGVDPKAIARESFQMAFAQPAFETLEEMLQNIALDAVYVASPHQFHHEDILQCISYGKVVMCEKPMTIDVESAKKIVEISANSNVPVLVGPSHSYDEPILKLAQWIAQDKYGPVKMLQMMNYTDFLFRPRRSEEMDVSEGGGVVFSQASHQIDIARLLCGGVVTQIHARVGNFDVRRSTVGAYQTHLDFDNGAFASLTYSGYAHYDSDELCSHVSELGFFKSSSYTSKARKNLNELVSKGMNESDVKLQANQSKIRGDITLPEFHEHFGFIVVSCEQADIKPLPDRIEIYADDGLTVIPLEKPLIPRKNVIDELVLAIERQAVLHDAKWALATVECVEALNQSARLKKNQKLHHQVTVPKQYFQERG